MNRVWLLAAAMGALVTGAGGGIAAEAGWWGPSMPVVRIDVKEASVPTPTLVLVYGEAGGKSGGPRDLSSGQIASCRTLAGVCATAPAGNAFHVGGMRRQSLQVRWLNADGQAALGGVVWEGSGYPRELDLRCDLTVSDPQAACSIVRVQD